MLNVLAVHCIVVGCCGMFDRIQLLVMILTTMTQTHSLGMITAMKTSKYGVLHRV